MLLSCHVSPTVCPGYHHRDGRRWTSGRGEEVIHEVCGPSRGGKEEKTFVYKLSLSALVLHSIN